MSAISPEAAFIFSQLSLARTTLCSAIPRKIPGIAKSGMSKPCFSLARTLAFGGLAFASTFTLASFTGLHPFKRNCNQQQTDLRPGPSEAHAASQKWSREPFPNFHRGQVASRIAASHPPEQVWLTNVGASVRFLTLTSDFSMFVTAGACAA